VPEGSAQDNAAASTAKAGKPAISVSAELAALIARKTS